jgi:oligopeptidase A
MASRTLSLPDFSRSMTDLCSEAVSAINAIDKRIEQALSENKVYTWDNLMAVIQDCDREIGKHLSLIALNYELRTSKDVMEEYTKFYDGFMNERQAKLLANKKLLRALRSVDTENLSEEQKYLIGQEIDSLVDAGLAIPYTERKKFLKVSTTLSRTINKFSNDYYQSLDSWSMHVKDEKTLDGISKETKDIFRKNAKDKSLEGWLVKIDESIVDEILTFATNRSLRQKVFFGYATLASDYEAREVNNLDVIKQILELRHEKAQLLGFKTFAHSSLSDKTISDPETIIKLLRRLDRKADRKLKAEIREISELAAQDGIKKVKEWDYDYYLRLIKKDRFNADDISDYLHTTPTFQRMLKYFGKMLGLRFVQKQAPSLIHQNMSFYHVYKDGQLIGAFYADIFRRTGKNDGAWVDHYAQLSATELPVLVYTTNSGKKLSHYEFTTMLHEFGHLLHGLLNNCEYTNIGGLNSMRWDAVEFPSQFMENFAWHPVSLRALARHHRTGESPNDKTIRAVIQSRGLDSGRYLQKYVKKALIDLRLHYEYASKEEFVEELANNVLKQNGIPIENWTNRLLCRFHHTFASEGSYDSGYYVYLWSELIARDAFSRFVSTRTDEGLGKLMNEFVENFLVPSRLPEKKEVTDLLKDFTGRQLSAKAWMKFYRLDK